MAREYKDSGIEWIGQIPKEWDLARFKFVSEMYTGNSLNEQQKELYSSSDSGNTLPYISTKDVERDIEKIDYDGGIRIPLHVDKFAIAPKNSVLLCIEGGSAGKKVGYTNQDVFFVNKLCCIKTLNNSRYFYYFILSNSFIEPFMQNIQGLIGGVSVSTLKNFVISIPPVYEQQKIANYLDKVCGEVDEMVKIQEQMIEELKTYKQSIITEAVTKGLNPNVPMKDSGIDWIGQIPEHWEIRRIGNLFKLRDEKNYKPMDEVQLLSLYTGIGVFPHGEQEERGNKAITVEGYKVVHKDDIVVNIILAWMGAIGVSNYDGVTSPAYDVYIPDLSNVVPHFFHYVFRTQGIAGECYKYGRGIMMMRWRTYSSEFKLISVPFPSMEEQQLIANFLDTKCAEIDALIAIKQTKIDELKEYKKSVIYEYVTGKKEVM